MDVGGAPDVPRTHEKQGRRARRRIWTLVAALFGLMLAAFVAMPAAHVASASALIDTINADDTPTATVDPSTPTPAVPPTLSLVSPASGQGPVGVQITVAGDHWTGSVAIGAIPVGAGDCANTSTWARKFKNTTAKSSGHISTSFNWPSDLTQTSQPYMICATNSASGTAGVTFQLASATAPALTISPSPAEVGTAVTVSGSDFFGSSPITLAVKTSKTSYRTIGTKIAPLSDGSFEVAYTPTSSDVGTLTFRATSASEGGAPAGITVTQTLTVQPAPTATPTTAVSTTTVIGAAPGTGSGSTGGSNGGTATAIVLIVVAILLLALAGVGIFFYLRLSRQGGAGAPGTPSPYGPTSQPGYGTSGARPFGMEYDASPTSQYAASNQYGRPGFPQTPDPYNQRVGGVALWDDQPNDAVEEDDFDEEPGPDWHPRPMTGHWRATDLNNLRPGGESAPSASTNGAPGFGPPDPWADTGADPYNGGTRAAGNPQRPINPWGND